ncbi:Mobile element protein [Candidatus Enterovibrio altilux]|uniref:Mobile element protein n=1 Tax=Candidatus Enterovibrio altilux TaxID=1927128 RepID=A0A291B7P3_9GAMM|nr:Mobile element protein [Candidatus Enterovibrio luxaltus]
MVKRVLSMPWRGLKGLINFVFKLAQRLLSCFHYACINKRAKTANIAFKKKTTGITKYLAIDSVGLKVYRESE